MCKCYNVNEKGPHDPLDLPLGMVLVKKITVLCECGRLIKLGFCFLSVRSGAQD